MIHINSPVNGKIIYTSPYKMVWLYLPRIQHSYGKWTIYRLLTCQKMVIFPIAMLVYQRVCHQIIPVNPIHIPLISVVKPCHLISPGGIFPPLRLPIVPIVPWRPGSAGKARAARSRSNRAGIRRTCRRRGTSWAVAEIHVLSH